MSRVVIALLLLTLHAGLAILYVFDQSPGTEAARTGLPLDDAWIHLVYGRSVASHGIPAYNGTIPEAGFTSPLWMLNTAVVHWVVRVVPISVVSGLKISGVLWAFVTSLAAFELVSSLTGRRWFGLLGGVLTGACPLMAFSQVSGMEVGAATACGVGALVLLHMKRPLACGILLAAAIWARPEFVILAGLVAGLQCAAWRTGTFRENRHAAIGLIAPSLLAVALWMVYCLVAADRPLPNTFYAKYNPDFPLGWRVLWSEIIRQLPLTYAGSGFILAAIGCLTSIRRFGVVGWTLALFPWVFFVGLSMSRPFPPGAGSYFFWTRYAAPGTPFLALQIAIGVWALATSEWASRDNRLRTVAARSRLMPVAALLLVVCGFVRLPARLSADKAQFAWNCQNMNEVHVELGRWIADHTPADAVLMVFDAGAVRYFSGRHTIDMLGLNSRQLTGKLDTVYAAGSSPEAMKAFMQFHGANFLVTFPDQFPAVFRNPGLASTLRVERVAQSSNYTVAGKGSGQTVMSVSRLQ